jgi:hypothetical protein
VRGVGGFGGAARGPGARRGGASMGGVINVQALIPRAGGQLRGKAVGGLGGMLQGSPPAEWLCR